MQIKMDKIDVAQVKALMSSIKNGYKKVIVTSINKTTATTKVQAKARIGNELNLPASRINKNMSIQKANYTKISGALISKGEPVGLIQFGATSKEKGVSVKILRASSRSVIGHAFVAKSKNKEHVFWRKDKRRGRYTKKFPVGKKSTVAWPMFSDKYRFPLERLTGPRIEDIFAKKSILDPVTIQGNFLFLKNVHKAVNDIFRRHAL